MSPSRFRNWDLFLLIWGKSRILSCITSISHKSIFVTFASVDSWICFNCGQINWLFNELTIDKFQLVFTHTSTTTFLTLVVHGISLIESTMWFKQWYWEASLELQGWPIIIHPVKIQREDCQSCIIISITIWDCKLNYNPYFVSVLLEIKSPPYLSPPYQAGGYLHLHLHEWLQSKNREHM